MRSGQKRRSERKFFPGYVLVQIATHDEAGIPRIDSESWHLIKETPKVMGFIGGTADRPLPIQDAEADRILQRVQEGVEKPRPKVLFEPGEMVRVVDGPFVDFNGVVEEINYEKSRPARRGAHFRPLDPGRAGIRAGRKGHLSRAGRPRRPAGRRPGPPSAPAQKSDIVRGSLPGRAAAITDQPPRSSPRAAVRARDNAMPERAIFRPDGSLGSLGASTRRAQQWQRK